MFHFNRILPYIYIYVGMPVVKFLYGFSSAGLKWKIMVSVLCLINFEKMFVCVFKMRVSNFVRDVSL